MVKDFKSTLPKSLKEVFEDNPAWRGEIETESKQSVW